MKIGLYGGSFNPPHLGHTLAVHYGLTRYDLDEVWVVPCYQHVFGKNLLDFDHRLQMVKIAMRHLRRIRVLPVEKELGGVSATIDTVRHLYSVHEGIQLHLMIGDDLLSEIIKWTSWEELLKLAPMKLLNRAEILPAVNSTSIRDSWDSGKDTSYLAEVMDVRVMEYMEEHELSWRK